MSQQSTGERPGKAISRRPERAGPVSVLILLAVCLAAPRAAADQTRPAPPTPPAGPSAAAAERGVPVRLDFRRVPAWAQTGRFR